MIKGAIFDLDGTLVDSMFIYETLGEDYLRTLGVSPQENLKETFDSLTLEQSAVYCKEHYGIALSAEEMIAGINDMVADHYLSTLPMKPGVAEFLNKLKENGVKMCVATVTDRHLAEAALVRLSLREYFSEIFTVATVGHGKDEPHIYRTAAEHLGTKKAETAVFEDAFYALKTAKKDGFFTVAVFDIYEKNQSGMKSLSDYYLESYYDTNEFLSSINK